MRWRLRSRNVTARTCGAESATATHARKGRTRIAKAGRATLHDSGRRMRAGDLPLGGQHGAPSVRHPTVVGGHSYCKQEPTFSRARHSCPHSRERHSLRARNPRGESQAIGSKPLRSRHGSPRPPPMDRSGARSEALCKPHPYAAARAAPTTSSATAAAQPVQFGGELCGKRWPGRSAPARAAPASAVSRRGFPRGGPRAECLRRFLSLTA
jgi:hypothetical protein